MKTNKHILLKTELLKHITECILTPHLCNFIYGEKAFKIAKMYYDKFYNNVENDNTDLKDWVIQISKTEDFANDFKFIDTEICKQLI